MIMSYLKKPFLGVVLVGLFLGGRLTAQSPPGQTDIETLKKSAPKVYIDCGVCDVEYIKTEITFVNYVRDRKEAHVHLLITTTQTGSGGREYTLSFFGQNECRGIDDTIKYFTNKTDTDDDIRKGLVKTLKMGLMTYVVRTPIASRIAVNYSEEEKSQTVADKWRSWVFSLSGDGYFNGEQSISQDNWGLNLSANKVTPDIKVRLGISADFSHDRFEYEGETIKSTRENFSASGLFVKALGEHWSAGISLAADSSSYANIRTRFAPAPAVEYNIFPYAQYARKQLRILYRFQLEITRYREETIYLKTKENLWRQALSATLNLKEKWGSITAALSASQYFHDLSKYNLDLYGALQLNLFKGFNVMVGGGGSRVHDQLALVRGVASLEEILLRQRQLETSYNYFLMFGLSYTFGSIFTNVVNPRFGRWGGGSMSISFD